MRTFLVTLSFLALAGCATQKKADSGSDAAPSAATQAPAGQPVPPAGSDAAAAAAPKAIEELTDQKLVYECPKCGMDFDVAGACSMDGSALVATRVSYVCPKDGQAVEHAGRCPRCPMNARAEKTAMAAAAAPGRN